MRAALVVNPAGLRRTSWSSFPASSAPAYPVLSGSIEVARRDDALGVLTPIDTHLPGELTGEIGSLSGGPALAEGRAGEEGAEAMPFDAAQLRSLVVGTAEIGETVMRAFVLRRAFLIEVGAGVVLLGSADSADSLSPQNFLRRNAVPYEPLDPATDAHARALIERLGITAAELPLAICPDGTVLRKPNQKTLAQCLGLLPRYLADRSYGVAIVGAGPAGLAAAVYGASEGLSVLVLDARSFGGRRELRRGEGAGVVAQLHLRLQALRGQPRAERTSAAPTERPGDLSEPVTAGRTIAVPLLAGAASAGA